MNNNTLELYKQAIAFAYSTVEKEYWDTHAFQGVVAGKFAQLIVGECISTVETAENGYEDYRGQIEDGMRDHCISLIKNKFGLEL